MIYDPFQEQAINYIKEGHSVIVSAPTGAGKTVIAEYIITDCLQKNKKAIYTAPIKALSNQKFRDFQITYKDKIGILTGDVSINPDAPILIMTTEIFRNKVLDDEESLLEYSWIIFDEIHYIDDYERGTVWEESLIFFPQHMKLLALSATIPNIDEFAKWLETIHKRPIKIVKEDKRPVPLHFFYQCQGKIIDNINSLFRIGYGKELFTYRHGRKIIKHDKLKQNRTSHLIKELQDKDRLPCIYFVFSRKRCEYLADEIANFNFLDEDERCTINNQYHDLCLKFGLLNEKSAVNIQPLIERGVAYHHAGMLPTLKEVIERLFTSKLIKVIFTTETFALGINMPARTVVFDELRKFYGETHRSMRTRDFYQMAGRAGRRGIDEEGFVYSRINPRFIEFIELKGTIFGDFEKVRSRFNASYATILNLYDKYHERFYDIYPLSFHYFQEKTKHKEKAMALLKNKVELLKKMGHIKDEKLTEKGVFASKVYGYELTLAEMYTRGALDKLSEIELGLLACALVYEPRKGSIRPPLSKSGKKLLELTKPIIEYVHGMERKAFVNALSKDLFFNLSLALEAWMENESFDKIMRFTDADEGEIIRYFRMTIQILRELLDTNTAPNIKSKIKSAFLLINRDIVDAERQLRIEETLPEIPS